jgi:hypothetical protein
LDRPHHPLESPAVAGSAVSVPGGDTIVHLSKFVRVLGVKLRLKRLSLLRLKRCCCAFFPTLFVWVDHFCLSVMCTQRNFCPVDVDRGVLPLLFPEVHDQLLCFVDVG